MDKEALFKPRLTEAEVDIPDVGIVRVRGLSRGEVFGLQQIKDVAAYERKILALGVVDPVLTQAEVQRWQEACPAGELEPVVDKIRQLSGLDDDADKSGVQEIRGEPSDGVRILPSGEAVFDGRGPTGADE